MLIPEAILAVVLESPTVLSVFGSETAFIVRPDKALLLIVVTFSGISRNSTMLFIELDIPFVIAFDPLPICVTASAPLESPVHVAGTINLIALP